MTMRRYGGIEGLRAWLAWMVVFSHILSFTGFSKQAPWLSGTLGQAADLSVLVFTIISGFVITHLILERREPYREYIVRRFLRIYPVYLVALAAGIGGTYLAFDTFLTPPWGELSPPTARMVKQAASLASSDLYWHLAAHLSMLHGAVSNQLLYESQYMFLGPAWSLSLEWQFYVVAPLVVAMATGRAWQQAALAVVAVLGFWLYWHGFLGVFALPSVLPGAALYFAVGIITRLMLKGAAEVDAFPLAPLILAFGLLTSIELRPMLVWWAFVSMMLLNVSASDVVSRGARRIFAMVFDSRLAHWLGDRSYATYLIHMPIVQGVTWVCVRPMHWGPEATFAAVLAVTVPATLVASMCLHRFVELPAMTWGRRYKSLHRHP
jgi:peptidoglycan/LPS O-acetylase OafA/YrhL